MHDEWSFEPAFEDLVEQDVTAWKRLGVERTPYLVRPSGSIKSPLAIHLLNPSFYVADAKSTVTDDYSNPTIFLLNQCGLSSKECFMFDQICRRDRTDDCLLFYTEDLLRPHRTFAEKIRANMSAAVEICFGEEVFKEVSKTVCLVRFPLWGLFEPVRLWLELDDSKSRMNRFIIQAYHPQFFCRPGRFGKSSNEFFETYGRQQDLAILMALQLAGLSSPSQTHFFERHFVRGGYPRIDAKQSREMKLHVKEALVAFQLAFPEKFKEYENRQARRKKKSDEFKQLKGVQLESLLFVGTYSDIPVSEEEQVRASLLKIIRA